MKYGWVVAENKIIFNDTHFDIQSSVDYMLFYPVSIIDLFENKITLTGKPYGISIDDFDIIAPNTKRYNWKPKNTIDDEIFENDLTKKILNQCLEDDKRRCQRLRFEAEIQRDAAQRKLSNYKNNQFVK